MKTITRISLIFICSLFLLLSLSSNQMIGKGGSQERNPGVIDTELLMPKLIVSNFDERVFCCIFKTVAGTFTCHTITRVVEDAKSSIVAVHQNLKPSGISDFVASAVLRFGFCHCDVLRVRLAPESSGALHLLQTRKSLNLVIGSYLALGGHASYLGTQMLHEALTYPKYIILLVKRHCIVTRS